MLRSRDDVVDIVKACNAPGDAVADDLPWSDPGPRVNLRGEPARPERLYGPAAVAQFVKETGVCARIIRAHEVCLLGFDFLFGESLLLALVLVLFEVSRWC
jgi:hypothetical protein